VAEVIYSTHALGDIERGFEFVRDRNPDAVRNAVMAVQSAVDNLAAHPLTGRRIEGELRELIISCGQTGYVALYRFVISRDEVRILALRHQRVLGFLP
jgi:plasmid stabilization system protein ParE